MSRIRRNRNSDKPEISLLNLIDVIFTLLVFFMITMTFNIYREYKLTLPGSSNETEVETVKAIPVEIIMNSEKEYFIITNGTTKPVTLESMKSELAAYKDKEKQEVRISADEHLEYKDVVFLMDEVKKAGIKSISLNLKK